MPWVRFDDQFPIHRKVDGLSDAAYRLHTSAIFWCARNLTDGFVSEDDLDGVTARVRTPARFAAECVSRGLWHRAREECASLKCPCPVSGDGWVIHDYWQYQPRKAKVLADRDSAARRQEKWRQGRQGYPQGKPPRNTQGGQDNGVSNAPVTPLLTATPPRPEGSGAGDRPERAAARASPAGSPAARPESTPVADVLPANSHRPATPDAVRGHADAIRQAITRKQVPP